MSDLGWTEMYRLQQSIRPGGATGKCQRLEDMGLCTSEHVQEKKSYGTASFIRSTATERGRVYLREFWETHPNCGTNCSNFESKFVKREGHDLCERCGALFVDGAAVFKCRHCKEETDRLYGLFVPHACHACADKKRKADLSAGRICRMCNKPYFDCCC